MKLRELVDHETGERYLAVMKRGKALLQDSLLSKGDAFTREERSVFGLTGLLPDHVSTIDEQLARVQVQYDLKTTDLGRNIFLNSLMDRNETLFFRYVIGNLADIVPIIYTPTVAQACSHWSRIYRRARGVYITPRDRGRIVDVLLAQRVAEPPVIVVTDNERILGIGDQGAGGLGIPIGKLALYTAAAGIHPARCMPISLDVGTNNEELLADPLYLGYRAPRLRGDAYFDLVDEFVQAVREVFPGALLQWEDFANVTSFTNLQRYRKVLPSFNDDIQGTAAMVVGGMIAATRHAGGKLTEHRVVIVGAGSAGVGIRDQIAAAMVADGISPQEARTRIFVLDSRGLVVDDRTDLSEIKRHLAVPAALVAGWEVQATPISLEDVVRNVRPSVLVGVSGRPGLFTEAVVREVARHVERPIVLPLSNPTSHTEVTPEDALRWTEGRAIVATGSPFPPVTVAGTTRLIGQANNVFIFPGMGLAILAVGAREVTDGMFLAAARALADSVGPEALARGQIYPVIEEVRAVSRRVAVAVAEQAIAEGVADPVEDVESLIAAAMWEPVYLPYRPAGG
jgi:Malic enzyme